MLKSIPNKTALILDDDGDAREMICKILNNMGVQTLESATLNKALDLLEEYTPHFIVSDIKLAQENGLDFLRHCHEKNKLKFYPFIIMSVIDDINVINQAFTLGAKEYITKPLNNASVIQKIKKILYHEEFISLEFATNKGPKITARIPSTIIAMNEIGIKVDTPLKLSSAKAVSFEGSIREELGFLDSPIIKRGLLEVTVTEKGEFTNEIIIAGISYQQANIIKNFLKKWQ